jgi:predicted GIY-YIG superfamily endonuclease
MKRDELINEQCWIYIIEQHEQQLSIGVAGNLRKHIKTCSFENSKKLIFYRCFPDTLSALGFKLLLENLSHNTVEQLIRHSNPTKKDLSKEIS